MNHHSETRGPVSLPNTEPMHEAGRFPQRLIREEAAEHPDADAPTMSDAASEAFIARQHQQADAWTREQTEPTDAAPIIRRMRAADKAPAATEHMLTKK